MSDTERIEGEPTPELRYVIRSTQLTTIPTLQQLWRMDEYETFGSTGLRLLSGYRYEWRDVPLVVEDEGEL